ncbi:MAG: DUF2934 domain-containing protein [Alphaproteobacteria bacterium]|nr:DUF2934 domain-containing protein [Alphaproteobacteria bacterium]
MKVGPEGQHLQHWFRAEAEVNFSTEQGKR